MGFNRGVLIRWAMSNSVVNTYQMTTRLCKSLLKIKSTWLAAHSPNLGNLSSLGRAFLLFAAAFISPPLSFLWPGRPFLPIFGNCYQDISCQEKQSLLLSERKPTNVSDPWDLALLWGRIKIWLSLFAQAAVNMNATGTYTSLPFLAPKSTN